MRALIFHLFFVLLVAFGVVSPVQPQEQEPGLKNYQKILLGEKAIEDLSAEELREVIVVYQRLLDEGSAGRGTPLPNYESLDIQIAHKNKLFIINNSKYEAYTSCFDFERGDKVVFLDGTPHGKCLTTQILNLRTDRTCKVWCE